MSGLFFVTVVVVFCNWISELEWLIMNRNLFGSGCEAQEHGAAFGEGLRAVS